MSEDTEIDTTSDDSTPAAAAPEGAEGAKGADTAADPLGLSAASDSPAEGKSEATAAPNPLGYGESYSFEAPRGAEMDAETHQYLSNFATPILREMGVTDNAQAQVFFEAMHTQGKQAREQAEAHLAQALKEQDALLEREVGSVEATALRGRANAAVGKREGGEAFAQALQASGVSRDPAVIKFLAALEVQEPSMNAGGGASGGGGEGSLVDFLTGRATSYKH